MDCIIDFSNHALLPKILAYALDKRLPAVIATTGHTEAERAQMREAAAHIPVFSSGNMSLGINVLISLAKSAAAALGSDFDIEIVEMHHNRKLDAPSGTALMIADGIREALPYERSIFMTVPSGANRAAAAKSASIPFAAARSSASTR